MSPPTLNGSNESLEKSNISAPDRDWGRGGRKTSALHYPTWPGTAEYLVFTCLFIFLLFENEATLWPCVPVSVQIAKGE